MFWYRAMKGNIGPIVARPAEVHSPLAEHVLLWSMRAWVIGASRNISVDARIGEAFAQADAPDAAESLLKLMCILGRGTTRVLNVGCLCSREMSADERLLVNIVALYQHGRQFEAMLLLRSVLKTMPALAAGDCAEKLAAGLRDAGHALAAPQLPAMQQRVLIRDRSEEGADWLH